ncbi:MAG: response regulator [Methyloceanibacter sp.]
MVHHSPPNHRVALIVDDEIAFAIGLKGALRALGFDICDLATDGEQAYWLALSDQPDVVVMDVCLEGGREGVEVARRLRKVCDAPIVFVTGYTDDATMDRIRDRVPGARVVHKPVYRDRLAEAVAAVVPAHQ